jgi:hypothetical protein
MARAGRQALPVSGVIASAQRLGSSEIHGPGKRKRQRKRAALVGPAIVILRGGHGGHDRAQRRRPGTRGEQLRCPGVGKTVHAHAPIRARQTRRPFDRFRAIGFFVCKRIKVPARLPAAAHILHDDHVSPPRIPDRVGVGVTFARPLIVGHPAEQDRAFSPAARPVNIGGEPRAIRQDLFDVALQIDLAQTFPFELCHELGGQSVAETSLDIYWNSFPTKSI